MKREMVSSYLKDVNMRELIHSFRKKDFRIETFRGHGAGGQHRNKTDSCVRITHIETGLSAIGTEHKEQSRNKKLAFERLGKRIEEHYKKEFSRPKERKTEVIRSYNEKRNDIVDHRTGKKYNFKKVLLNDGLDEIIQERK